MHGGPLAEISKLLQEKAPEAIEQIPPHQDQTRAPQSERDDQAGAQRQLEAQAAEGDAGEEQAKTAAELEAAAAAKAAKGEKPAAEEFTDEEKLANADQAAPLTVGDIARKLDIDPRRLYEDLRIPLREGRGAITLSELKQGYQDNALLEDGRDKVAAERMSLQTDTANAVAEINTATALLGQAVGEANVAPLLEQAQRINNDQLTKGRQVMLERFPEWKDPATYDAARNEMAAHLAEFNFSRADLENIRDPRHVLYIQANMKRDRQVAAARAKIDDPKPPPRQRAPSNRKPPEPRGSRAASRLTRQAAASGRREDKLSAISAVIARQAKD